MEKKKALKKTAVNKPKKEERVKLDMTFDQAIELALKTKVKKKSET